VYMVRVCVSALSSVWGAMTFGIVHQDFGQGHGRGLTVPGNSKSGIMLLICILCSAYTRTTAILLNHPEPYL
jgi:hypothetical protein